MEWLWLLMAVLFVPVESKMMWVVDFADMLSLRNHLYCFWAGMSLF